MDKTSSFRAIPQTENDGRRKARVLRYVIPRLDKYGAYDRSKVRETTSGNTRRAERHSVCMRVVIHIREITSSVLL
jgi:hypothetical protein